MNRRSLAALFVLCFAIVLAVPVMASAENPSLTLLASGLEGASGSVVGPDGALYITEGAAGGVSRVDPQTGEKTIFASGLPTRLIPLGGAIDIAFIDETAYVLVTLVSSDLGGSDYVGIYRVDDEDSFTVIADIGTFSLNNPPETDFFFPTGLQFAMDAFQDGFLVTDGHHNRVLYVTLDGDVSEMLAFDNVVPTGLEVHGNTVYMAEAGANPHLPENGKVVSFGSKSSTATEIASGVPLIVDVGYGLGRNLYALAQGEFPVGSGDGSPALPHTGSLVKVNDDGTFTTVFEGLNLPTSMEFIDNTVYIVNLAGEIWKIENVSSPPYGNSIH